MTLRILSGVIAPMVVAALLVGGHAVAAQKPVSVSDMVTETFTIEAINSTSRIVTLKDKDGNLEELFCGPPKKASGVATDLDGNAVREFGLAASLVDYKIAAIDAVWSGLCFARRKARREDASP